jgi:competence protein ComGC
MYIVLLVYIPLVTHLIKVIIYSQKGCQCLVQILENTSELMQADFICSKNVHMLHNDTFLMRNRSSYAVF